MKNKIKKGSLCWNLFGAGVGSMMAFMRFQDMKNEQDTVIAKAVGQQIKQMGRRSMVISISAMTSFLR